MTDSLPKKYLDSFRERVSIKGETFREKFDGLLSRWSKIIDDCNLANHSEYRVGFAKLHENCLKIFNDCVNYDDTDLRIAIEDEYYLRIDEYGKLSSSLLFPESKSLSGYLDGLCFVIAELELLLKYLDLL